MTTPYVPVLMVALTELQQTSNAGRLPNVKAGHSFWCKYSDVAPLTSAGYARAWQPGDPPAPLPEPPYTAHGIPGIAAGTTNASH
jgi:hypothetical protein